MNNSFIISKSFMRVFLHYYVCNHKMHVNKLSIQITCYFNCLWQDLLYIVFKTKFEVYKNVWVKTAFGSYLPTSLPPTSELFCCKNAILKFAFDCKCSIKSCNYFSKFFWLFLTFLYFSPNIFQNLIPNFFINLFISCFFNAIS